MYFMYGIERMIKIFYFIRFLNEVCEKNNKKVKGFTSNIICKIKN